eukprot:TRINITY_DN4508_c0_g1_i1.p1 TRINITY_DN4508_c0_g1~~TRINITY_DN4508_c0_g1_i1.p1  ORF type:complete len:328 (+),score=91.56 TRINITY_DN4508_c0_g1_i1:331-1314(+)
MDVLCVRNGCVVDVLSVVFKNTKHTQAATIHEAVQEEYEVDEIITSVVDYFSFGDSFAIEQEVRQAMKPKPAPTKGESDDQVECKLLKSKARSSGFTEILMPVGAPRRTEGINIKTLIQRYRIQDLQENAEESEKAVVRLTSILKEQEASYKRIIEERESLIAQTVEEEAIRRDAESSARIMQRQIDALYQGIEDYKMQSNDLEGQLKQLRLEIRLLEIINGGEKDEDKSRSIQTILSDMKAELTQEEVQLAGLREVTSKLEKEAMQDEVWRMKYEQELCQLQEQIEIEASYQDEDEEEYSFERDGENKIYGFSAPLAQSFSRSTRV